MLRNEDIGILVEALPYLRDFKDKVVVVKFGGKSMTDPTLRKQLLQDIIFLQCAGLRPSWSMQPAPKCRRCCRRPARSLPSSTACA